MQADQTRYVVLDTETTGLEPKQGHKIIEIGCVELVERRLTGNNYQQFINPEREVDEGAANVHGYTLADLQDNPTFAAIAADFIEYVRGATLIIHNAAFDLGFLDHELSLLNKNLGPMSVYCQVLDTLGLAREMHPGQRNSLDALCQRYHVENAHRTFHGALLDSEILADVYLRMTGGQLNLLGDGEENSDGSEASVVQRLDSNRVPIKVTEANAKELAEHQKWLAMLSEQTNETISW